MEVVCLNKRSCCTKIDHLDHLQKTTNNKDFAAAAPPLDTCSNEHAIENVFRFIPDVVLVCILKPESIKKRKDLDVDEPWKFLL